MAWCAVGAGAQPRAHPAPPANAKNESKNGPSPAPRVLQRAAAEKRAPPKPRRVWRMPSRRWRSAVFKGAAAVAIASLAVAYQDSAPRTEARGAGMMSSQSADLVQAMQLVGHTGPVIGVATSDQGRWVVSAGADATLRVWNAGSGALV